LFGGCSGKVEDLDSAFKTNAVKGVDHQPRVHIKLASGRPDQVADRPFKDEYRMDTLGSQPIACLDEALPTSGGEQVREELRQVLLAFDQDPGLEAF
jgi:hypothetical protein